MGSCDVGIQKKICLSNRGLCFPYLYSIRRIFTEFIDKTRLRRSNFFLSTYAKRSISDMTGSSGSVRPRSSSKGKVKRGGSQSKTRPRSHPKSRSKKPASRPRSKQGGPSTRKKSKSASRVKDAGAALAGSSHSPKSGGSSGWWSGKWF